MHYTSKNPAVKPIKNGDHWRIIRADGEHVGRYATKELAEKNINNSPWLHDETTKEHEQSHWGKGD